MFTTTLCNGAAGRSPVTSQTPGERRAGAGECGEVTLRPRTDGDDDENYNRTDGRTDGLALAVGHWHWLLLAGHPALSLCRSIVRNVKAKCDDENNFSAGRHVQSRAINLDHNNQTSLPANGSLSSPPHHFPFPCYPLPHRSLSLSHPAFFLKMQLGGL